MRNEWEVDESSHKHLLMSHVTNTPYECHMAHLQLTHPHAVWLIHMCFTYECVTRHIHMGGITQSYGTWHSSSPLSVTWPIQVWDMTHSYVWHDSFICVTWPIHRFVRPWQSSSPLCVTWLIHICDVTLFVRLTCVMTHSYTWCVPWHSTSPLCVTWHIHMWDTTQFLVTWRDTGIPDEPCHIWMTYMWHESIMS